MNTRTIISTNADKRALDANFDAIADRAYMLRDRWADERAYEDFAHYRDNMRKFLATFGIIMKSMSKSFRVTTERGLAVTFAASGRVRIAY